MPNNTITNYQYNQLNQITQIQTQNSNNQIINSNIYSYDNVGNKLTKQDPSGTHNYTYDNTYQLIQSTLPTESFTYDAVGNRTNTTVDAANKLLQDSNATYQYDANGNRYIKTQSDGTITYYSYDYEGRLTRVETQKPSGTTISVYKYDSLGRRIEKNVDGVVTRYLYSNEGLIAEYDANNNLKKSYGWLPNGIWGTDPIYMTENNQTYYYHNDALGTPQKMTDANGNVVWSAAYTAFGEATIDASSTITNNLRFAGQYFDQETGTHYNLFRVYDPKTGTYISKDPIGFAAGDTNLYRFVRNRPTVLIDPLGLYDFPYTMKGWIGAALASGGIAFIAARSPVGVVMFVGGAVLIIWDVIEGAPEALEEAEKKLEPAKKSVDELKKELEDLEKQEKGACPNKGDKK